MIRPRQMPKVRDTGFQTVVPLADAIPGDAAGCDDVDALPTQSKEEL